MLLILILLVIIFPIIYTILCSFKSNAEILAHPETIVPRAPTLDNYIQAWNTSNFSVSKMLFNSIYYTLGMVVITLIMSAVAGYVFARGNFPGKKAIFAVFTALMFVSLGTITMYPYFKVLDFMHIEKSLSSLLLIRCFAMPTANVYLVKGFLEGIPKELDEAAKIDGCGFVGIFGRIIFPLLKPILATIGILTFQGSWNEYLYPLIFTMSKPEQRPLIVGIVQLKSTGEAAASWNLMLAGTTIALIPVLIAYIFANRYFVEGIAAGAVKG
jgi:multiple sugar transport system permease protein